jgi:hypothetical protein
MSNGIIINKTLSEEIKKLVIARLESMPEDMRLSFGGTGNFDKYALIEQVKEETEIGRQIANMQLSYLRSFKR